MNAIQMNQRVSDYLTGSRPPTRPLGLEGEFTFIYVYPFKQPEKKKHVLSKENIVADILGLAADDYGQIPENKWSAHNIHSLWFEGLKIDPETKTVQFLIGS